MHVLSCLVMSCSSCRFLSEISGPCKYPKDGERRLIMTKDAFTNLIRTILCTIEIKNT